MLVHTIVWVFQYIVSIIDSCLMRGSYIQCVYYYHPIIQALAQKLQILWRNSALDYNRMQITVDWCSQLTDQTLVSSLSLSLIANSMQSLLFLNHHNQDYLIVYISQLWINKDDQIISTDFTKKLLGLFLFFTSIKHYWHSNFLVRMIKTIFGNSSVLQRSPKWAVIATNRGKCCSNEKCAKNKTIIQMLSKKRTVIYSVI